MKYQKLTINYFDLNKLLKVNQRKRFSTPQQKHIKNITRQLRRKREAELEKAGLESNKC